MRPRPNSAVEYGALINPSAPPAAHRGMPPSRHGSAAAPGARERGSSQVFVCCQGKRLKPHVGRQLVINSLFSQVIPHVRRVLLARDVGHVVHDGPLGVYLCYTALAAAWPLARVQVPDNNALWANHALSVSPAGESVCRDYPSMAWGELPIPLVGNFPTNRYIVGGPRYGTWSGGRHGSRTNSRMVTVTSGGIE